VSAPPVPQLRYYLPFIALRHRTPVAAVSRLYLPVRPH